MKSRGMQIHQNRLRRMQNVKAPALRALYEAAEVIRDDAQQSIIAGSISGPGHVASLPGQPPNADTHELDLSIDVVINPSQLTASIVAKAPYSAALEFGTSTILPRPFLRPALQRNRNRLLMGVAQAVSGDGVRVFKSDGAFANSRARYENGG
jgi:HK97 gp10 family phage protein